MQVQVLRPGCAPCSGWNGGNAGLQRCVQTGGCGVEVLLDPVQVVRDQFQAACDVTVGGDWLLGEPVGGVLDEPRTVEQRT